MAVSVSSTQSAARALLRRGALAVEADVREIVDDRQVEAGRAGLEGRRWRRGVRQVLDECVGRDQEPRGARPLFLVCDGLKGLPDSVAARFPATTVQACVIHLIRGTFRDASKRY